MPKMSNRLLPSLRRVVLVRETAERSDGQLLTAFLVDRDGDAFAALVRRHGPMVLGVARRVIGDVHLADDAFQAVFLVLARRAAAVRPREQVGNWLYGVAYRTAMKARTVLARRRSREKQVDAMPEPPVTATRGLTASGSPEWNDLQPIIDEELARLPDKLRVPIVLCDLEGRPQRTVASHLGIAPATLASRLASARRILAARLGRRGISLSGGALAVALGERASAAVVAPPLAEATVRAAEALAAGAATSGLTGLVSAHAIQLCEGVLRMMLITKLKTAGITALAVLVLSGGLGFGLLPAQAGDEPAPTQPAARKSTAPRIAKASEPITDSEFLRRLVLDLTGLPPNVLEMNYFTADTDKNKRAKVVDWLVADESVRAHLARKLGVPVERIQVLRAADDKGHTFRLAIIAEPNLFQPVTLNAAFSPDDKVLTTAVDQSAPVRDEVDLSATVALNGIYSPTRISRLVALDHAPANLLWTRTLRYIVQPPSANGNGEGASEPDPLRFWVEGQPRSVEVQPWITSVVLEDTTDSDFLREAIQAARGAPPTALEEKYFAEDKDPKKREKLLDTLLKDPAVAKKLGEDWKKKMLEPKAQAPLWNSELRGYTERVMPLNFTPHIEFLVRQPDKFEKLIDELIVAKKTDEQILEAIVLAAAGRLPTAEERKATLAIIGTLTDKKQAWVAIARVFAPPEKKAEEKKRAAPPK
jgi:RNA polymerase sigma factor (sigma-70 family)